MRKSATSGHVHEAKELFGLKEGRSFNTLAPLQGATRGVSYVKVDEEGKAKESASTDLTQLVSRLLPPSSAAGPDTVKEPQNAPLVSTKRLVVFDSTDVEFDEDSDPDRDLDL